MSQASRPSLDATRAVALAALALLTLACGLVPHDHENHDDGHDHGTAEEEDQSWAVTAWGEHYEIFAEAEPLAAGAEAKSHTHVTLLGDFSAMTTGTVAAVLRAAGGGEQVFRQESPVRPGIYNVVLQPASAGEYELFFRVAAAAGEEEIPAGRVQVGPAGQPGGLIEAPAPPPAAGAGEPVGFLKEQQWRTPFATVWVERGELRRSVRGLGRVLPSPGGEVVLTAPIDALVLGEGWPFPGQTIGRGRPVFRLAPRVAEERSLAELTAQATTLEGELGLARARQGRLAQLLAVEAVSRREVEENAAGVSALEARLDAARRDLEAARATRTGKTAGTEPIAVAAPFEGRVAAVEVTPGQAVDAGAALGRLVKTDPVWLQVALHPAEAAQVGAEPAGLLVTVPGGTARRYAPDAFRLAARSPELDARTGTVGVFLELAGAELTLGSAIETEILLPEPVAGVVVPISALVDDGGTLVVFLQIDGESFGRQPVEVLVRQGEHAIVTGLVAGQRLVTRGGAEIRRSALLAGGEVEGHVH
jgi:RND family efflux transporter MFP subunit